MTEDQNDQTTEGPVSDPNPETTPTAAVPETTSQAAIPMPAASPAPTEHGLALPQQPDTPPMGVAQDPTPPAGSTPPQGTYAMGALAGNPMLGERAGVLVRRPPAHRPRRPHVVGPPGAGRGGSQHPPPRPQRPAGRSRRAGRPRRRASASATPRRNSGGQHAGLQPGLGQLAGALELRAPIPRGAPAPRAAPSATAPPSATAGSFGDSGSSGNTGSGSSGSSNSSGPSDVNAIASKIDPGLVDINTTLGYQQEQAAGTGIVLSSNGVILTNNHVIDGATSISVTDIGNNKTYTASVVGYDRTKDIAVLQLQNASGLQTATLGNSSNVSVGQDVVGVGNAGGTGGTPSAAGGTVTALNQSITASDDGDGTSEQLSGLIETNADIQPGDSGGALVDTSGNVLGIDTAASAGFSFQSNDQSCGNQGFAIPINTALSLARAIEAGSGSSTIHIGETAFLGVEINASDSSSGGNGGNSGDGSGFGGFFGGNSGSTGTPVHRVDRLGRLGGQHGHERSGARSRPGRGRRHHLAGRQDHRLGQRPHQRHERLPPRRQGEHRLDRRIGPDAHRHGAALLRSPAVSRTASDRIAKTGRWPPASQPPPASRCMSRRGQSALRARRR